MPAKPIATLLKFGHPQMAADAFLIDRDTGKSLIPRMGSCIAIPGL